MDTTTQKNKAVLHFGGCDVTLSSRLAGTTNEFSNGLNYVFNVTIKLPAGNEKTLKFHTSQADHDKSKNWMDESDLTHAMYCFLSDACAGRREFEDFAKEFGYDEDSRKAYAIWGACQTIADDIENLFTDAEKAMNDFREAYPNV